MKYFSTLPQLVQTDSNGNTTIATNILARTYFQQTLKDNLNVMYQYDIKDGDTPENIAYRYYGTVDRFWIVLMSNNILDPQWEWPLTSTQFSDFLVTKYSEAANTTDPAVALAYTQGTTHHYEQDITTFNSDDQQKQTVTIEISEEMFNDTLNETTTVTIGNTLITKQINRRAVSIYDYEMNKNESHRRINILRDVYVNQIENQFKVLMR
jgi:hypothetical protein